YMAAIAAVEGLVPDGIIRDFARTFNGVEHRIELVRTYHGVRYYNDSIASSPSRTIAGLRSFPEQVILIAGGYDKHIPFDVLGPEIVEHVKLLVLCGATAGKIRAAVEQAPGYRPDHPEILEVTPFQRAVEAARDRAQPSDVVTLSPPAPPSTSSKTSWSEARPSRPSSTAGGSKHPAAPPGIHWSRGGACREETALCAPVRRTTGGHLGRFPAGGGDGPSVCGRAAYEAHPHQSGGGQRLQYRQPHRGHGGL
ncbi:MAG: glutamate ligase domain-containing protein, partial [Oscillospiraceae bacterium]